MGYGKNIRAARKAAGMTQEQLAKKCEVATITIRQYELEKREPRLEQLQAISRALNVDLEMLLSDEPKKLTGPAVADQFRVAGFSLAALSEQTNIPKEKLHQMARGEHLLITPEEQKELSAVLDGDNLLDFLFSGDGLNISAIAADVRKQFSLDIETAMSITDHVVDLCTGYFRTEPEETVARLLWLLNEEGISEAIKRVGELTEIPKYQA